MRVLDEIGWPSLLKTENLVQGEGVLQPCLFQFFRASRAGAAFAFVCTLGLAHRAAAKTNSGSGKTHRQMDLAAARADRKAIVGANMNLTEAQAKAFWPLYDAYEKRMDKLEDPADSHSIEDTERHNSWRSPEGQYYNRIHSSR